MQADEAYRWLVGDAGDNFDTHVCASVLALAHAESLAGNEAFSGAVGLDGVELATLAAEVFPHAVPWLVQRAGGDCVSHSSEEACLLDLLQSCATRRSPFEGMLAAIIARRAQQPNHLWQDLGLRNREELNCLMERHFALLAQRNSRNMKWKKFLYRIICQDQNYSLCTAPSCAECDDFQVCFGDEDGESLLARIRREESPAATSG